MKSINIKDIKDSLFIKPADTILYAIDALQKNAEQILLVTDANEKLIGTITDGDIRRAFLKKKTMDTSVEQIMFRDFRFFPEGTSKKEVAKLMKQDRLHQIPLLDKFGRVVELVLIESLIHIQSYSNRIVIMAGGEGKRLLPLTENCPKPMLRVSGKPLLEIIIEKCLTAGFDQFIITVNYLKEQIMDYFGDGSDFGVKIEYIEENRPLGTAGALSLLSSKPTEPFFVVNGDVLTSVDYGHLLRFHDEQASQATLCIRDYTTQVPYGVVYTDGLQVQSIEEKPILKHYVNSGIYLLNPELLDLVPSDTCFDMPELLQLAIKKQISVNVFPIHEYWLDIGLPETLQKAHEEWK